MSYFLSEKDLELGKIFSINGEEARHILLSRRIKPGEEITLQDRRGKRFVTEVKKSDRKSLEVLITREIIPPREPEFKIYIFQSFVKEQPLDNILQKTTELGATGIFFFNSENGHDRFKDVGKKILRWKKISLEAAKQSDRLSPLELTYIPSQEELIFRMKEIKKIFLLDPEAKKTFHGLGNTRKDKNEKIGIIVGPEGGFSDNELDKFSKLDNLTKIKMGPRILRTDTAGIATVAILQSMFGDLG